MLGDRTLPDLLFYVCADRLYEDFAPLFIASSLWSVEGAAVEVGLQSVERFVGENRALRETCGEPRRHSERSRG